MFLFGCAGSWLLRRLFSSCRERGLLIWRLLLLQSAGPRVCGLLQFWLLGSRAHAQQLHHMGLVDPWYVKCSRTRDRTCAPCIDRRNIVPLSYQGSLWNTYFTIWGEALFPGETNVLLPRCVRARLFLLNNTFNLYVRAQSLSCVRLFVTLWTVACQAPLSMGSPRQEYWSELPFPSKRDLPNPETKPESSALTGGFFSAELPGKPSKWRYWTK